MQYPGYGPLESIDASNWPIWLLSGILALCLLAGIAWLFCVFLGVTKKRKPTR